MLHALQKLVGKKAEVATYDLILFQSKSHRAFKSYLQPILETEGLTTLDWSVMGILHNNRDGLRYNQIAIELTVEPPFVTELMTKLTKKNLVTSKNDIKDRRAKSVVLTKKGENIMNELEKQLQEKATELFKNITASEFETYKNILQKLADLPEDAA